MEPVEHERHQPRVEGFGQRATAVAQRFYFAAHEDDAGVEGVLDRIVAAGLSVLRDGTLVLVVVLRRLGFAVLGRDSSPQKSGSPNVRMRSR